ncbi:MAG: hypothetical protein ABIU77_04960, partial [Ferruginibacter sp.]
MSHFYRLTVVFFLLIWCKEIAAQTLQLPGTEKKIVRCYTTEIISEFRKKHPQAETDAQFETWLSKKNQDRKAQRAQVINYTIPIIFHVISKGNAADDISATAINEQLLQLNKDFANLANSQYAAAAPT